MTDKQPEALRLADLMENEKHVTDLALSKAAAELRRLHAVNAELVEALKLAEKRLIAKCDKDLVAFNGKDVNALTAISAAIAKATGEQQ
jgi:hypothetical protein